MAALPAARRYEIIADTLARAEEQSGVDLAAVAADHGLDLAQLKQVLDPVLYLQFRDASGDMIDASRAYLVTEDDWLQVTEEHWLGAARSSAPTPDHALRLMIAAMIAKAALASATPRREALDAALAKLVAIVDAPIVIATDRPEFTAVCERALASARTVEFDYFGELSAQRRHYEIEPGYVGSNWGHWYLIGHPFGTGDVRTFRIDRMISARVSDRGCVPDRALVLPDGFDLAEYRRTFRARLPRRALDRIPTPAEVVFGDEDPGDGAGSGDDLVLVDITVIGDHRLTDLLVMLGAEAHLLDDPTPDPPTTTQRRRDQAARILALYR
jgi:predicted DNA-binding transcriptional regulator YafY